MVTNYDYRKIKQSATRYKRRSDGYRLERDNWKAKALAYRGIIARTKQALEVRCSSHAWAILAEADKLEGK
jgi:hypothetical protein